LYHDRPYKIEENLNLNKKIRQETKQSKKVFTHFGINKK